MRYRYRLEERRERKNAFIKLIRRLAIFALILLLFYTLFLFFGGRPQLSQESLKELSFIASEKSYQLSFSKPVKELKLYLLDGEEKREIYKIQFPEPQKAISLTLKAKELGLKDGKANLILEAYAGPLSKKSYQFEALVDTIPPKLNIVDYTSYPLVGGTGAVKVRLEEEAQVYILHGDYKYPLYSLGNGYYFGLFPIRLDVDKDANFYLLAVDKVGNTSRQSLSLNVKQFKFKEDSININMDFINKVIYPLLGKEGEGLSPVEAFKKVNEVWRSRDIKKIEEIAKNSDSKFFWDGAFIQLPNSKVFATYGDIRHYYYEGQKISESRHMGFDFASVERSPIPASNSGVVVFTGEIGIYGNTVIIDHGMGLMSLYAHLSEISVKEGQFVKKGEIIGKTGKTGFALGDHLHFGILIHGYEVNPLEWLDPKWIRNNVLRVLNSQ